MAKGLSTWASKKVGRGNDEKQGHSPAGRSAWGASREAEQSTGSNTERAKKHVEAAVKHEHAADHHEMTAEASGSFKQFDYADEHHSKAEEHHDAARKLGLTKEAATKYAEGLRGGGDQPRDDRGRFASK